jgi:anti-sigma-K factor RskA
MAMSPSENLSPRDENESLLPFYLNGTLEGEELARVAAWLRSDPAAMAALVEAEDEFSAAAGANEAIRPPADALSRFTTMLDAEAGPARAAAAPSMLARLWSSFTAIPATVAWAVAAVAIGFVLVQAITSTGERGADFDVAGSQDDLAAMPFALATFKADARLADIAAFLADNGLTIIGGPAAGGVFKIGMSATDVADYDRLLGLIAAQPFADAVLVGRKPNT